MNLQEAVRSVEQMQKFFKALSKMEEVLNKVIDLEKKEVETINRVNNLTEREAVATESLENIGERLEERKANYGVEIADINRKITAEKERTAKPLDDEITARQELITKLENQEKGIRETFKDLDKEKRQLEVKVNALRKVLTGADNMVASVE